MARACSRASTSSSWAGQRIASSATYALCLELGVDLGMACMVERLIPGSRGRDRSKVSRARAAFRSASPLRRAAASTSPLSDFGLACSDGSLRRSAR